MSDQRTFASLVTGPISYEEIHQRCLDFIQERKIKQASFEVLYIANSHMGYGVWLRWVSGWWIFKKSNYCSTLYGVHEEAKKNVLGYPVDIDAKTTYKSSRRAFGPGRVAIRTEMAKSVGCKARDGAIK